MLNLDTHNYIAQPCQVKYLFALIHVLLHSHEQFAYTKATSIMVVENRQSGVETHNHPRFQAK